MSSLSSTGGGAACKRLPVSGEGHNTCFLPPPLLFRKETCWHFFSQSFNGSTCPFKSIELKGLLQFLHGHQPSHLDMYPTSCCHYVITAIGQLKGNGLFWWNPGMYPECLKRRAGQILSKHPLQVSIKIPPVSYINPNVLVHASRIVIPGPPQDLGINQ